MLKTVMILALLATSAPTVAFAQQGDTKSRGDRACKNDASRICRKVIEQGDSAVLACLQANQARLGGSCRSFLKEQGQL